MSRQSGHHLTFEQVEALVDGVFVGVEKGEEFRLEQVHIYRSIWLDVNGDPQRFYTANQWKNADFSREEYKATDWSFVDNRAQEAIPLSPADEKKLVSKVDVHTAVSFALGRFYYSNPDSHKIVPEVLKRLGFS